jgi:hypothetical protein
MKLAIAFALLLLGQAMLAMAAADAALVEPPAGFSYEPRHVVLPVIYSEDTRDLPNPIVRATVEDLCDQARKLDPQTPYPVFESGYDRPDTLHSVVIASAAQSVHFSTARSYVGLPGRAHACARTYQVVVSRRIYIRRISNGHQELINIDLDQGTGTRRVSAYRPAPASSAAGSTTVGLGHVAGIDCTIRRFNAANGGWVERCAIDDPDRSLPPQARGLVLSETWFALEGGRAKRLGLSWTTDRARLDARADAGVFDPPRSIRLRDLGAAGGQR